MAETNPLQLLTEHGQSVWLDYISRELVTTDRLQRYVEEDCVSGLTSNPTIFQKAVAEGDEYDEHLRQLVQAGVASPDELFLGIAISDIQRAADTFRDIYDRTGGRDGFVSLELAPALAHDTDGSVAAAQMLWERVERPNLMIKVPATQEGIPAVERLIAAGVNVNITLIFALTAYEQVAEAYVRGLERRAERGEEVNVRSVASFFVSRVDTAVDKIIERRLQEDPGNKELESLLGTAAIANAQLAYETFEQIFRGERFAALREKNAAVQRPLWASTSAKNPRYRDVVYAEALIGPDTVDTMPPQTIEAFKDHGIVAGDTVRGYEWAHDVMRRLDAAGIDMDEVTADLLDAGLESFAASYDELIHSIAVKADQMRGGLGRREELHLGADTDIVETAVSTSHAARLVHRIWEHDPNVWKPDDTAHAKEITQRLGWLDVVDWMRQRLPEVRRIAADLRTEGIEDVVVLGMGGSSLCPEVLRQSFGKQEGHPTLHVLDTTDPVAIKQLSDALDPRRSLFVVSSKSGGTLETLSHFAHFFDLVARAGVETPGRHFVAVTDPGTSLQTLAEQHKFRHVFENRPDIGGRYSALSYFGIVPAALAGIDAGKLLDRAAKMTAQCGPDVYPPLNAGLVLGTAMGLLHSMGRDKVTILAPPPIASFGLWAEQLIAESTGKEGKGIVPIAAEPLGDPDVYGGDRLFVALRLGDNPEFDRAVQALEQSDQPVVTLILDDLYDLGAEFFRWEFAVAVAGASLQVDVFDQPNVQESKDNTSAVLQHYLEAGHLPRHEEPAVDDEGIAIHGDIPRDAATPGDALREFLEHAIPGDYVALLAYVPPTESNQAAFQELRVAIRDRREVATTFGFGPRYLHSTGQLHKGGPNIGVFLEFTVDDPVDVPIPRQQYTFSVLKQAQALGDLQSLRAHDRRVINLHISGDLAAAVRSLTAAVREQVGAAR
jgi:transaldolase / glucose-6-phosphate isomerase